MNHMSLTEVAYAKNRAFHTAEFQSLGAATEVLWKGGAKSQRDRFDQIVRVLPDLSGFSILDVGCGFADFYSYLRKHGCRDFEYVGIDICTEMVEECRQRHRGDAACEFHEAGILEFSRSARRFDVAIASGLFAMPMPNWNQYIQQTIDSMFQVTSVGIAANFLSAFSQSPSPESHYAEPARVLDQLMHNTSPWAVLLHDYRWNDFTVGLFHQPRN
jgi:ubiquinone/menaquinone biosynthesis C-methylase UbiE